MSLGFVLIALAVVGAAALLAVIALLILTVVAVSTGHLGGYP